VISTELLSLFGLLSPNPVRILWVVFAIAALRRARLPAWPGIRFAAPFLLVLCLTLIVALVAPPNTWDSMTYHLARTSHWIANQNVEHYPTSMASQLMMPPFAEFAVAHLRLLIGGADYLVNLVQWAAFIVGIAALWMIARELTGNPTLAWLAAVVVATTPMTVLQASSTQNDLACAAMAVTFVVFALRTARGETRAEWWAAGALGLAFAAKNTAAAFVLPFLLYVTASMMRRGEYRKVLVFGVACVAAMGAFTGPHFFRNWRTYEDVMGDPRLAHALRVTRPSGGAVVSTAVRSLAPQFSTRWPAVNRSLEEAVASGHGMLGLDVNDPNTTFLSWRILLMSGHEDSTSNLILTVLLLAAFPFVLIRRPPLRAYTLCVLAGFLLHCGIIKWQPWGSRFLVTFFVLAAVPVAALLERRARMAATVLTLCAVPWLLFNSSRPLIPNGVIPSILTTDRTELYFANRWQERHAFLALGERLRSLPCRTVGLKGHGDTWEYAFWVLAPEVRIRHVEVSGASAKLSEPGVEQPCAIIRDTPPGSGEPPEFVVP
jgi:4-amino-4-deoxy-L-arabinose transferase-like glycosyltransferase